jgi:hypothetical protein
LTPSPNPGAFGDQLNGVSCPAVNFCAAIGDFWATGDYPYHSLAERWNGPH